jgi:pimeloyl-ACP methyl ester carboxylesterase
MDAIIPLMPESAAILNTPTGATALARLFAALRSATALDRVLAVGHDAGLLAQAEDAGLSAVLLAAPQPPCAGGVLPVGGAEALERLAAEDRRTLLVSCANPLLTGQVIDDFVRQAEAAQRSTVSVTPARDHPCQLSQHLRMHEAGVLLPLDQQAGAQTQNGGARLLTKPFRFLWAAQQTRGQGPLFVLGCAQGDPLFLSVPDEADPPASGPLLVREGEDSARLSLPAHELRELAGRFGVCSLSAVAGVGLHLSPGLPCLGFRDANGAASLGFAARNEGRRLCQVYAQARPDGQNGERRASLDLTGDPPRAELPWSLGEIDSPVSYNLLDYLDSDGGFDLTQAFPEEHHGLWRVDPGTGCRMNCISGRTIHGRQEFPEVLEPDGSLSALTRAEAARFDELLHAGEVAAFVLERGQSLQLRTPFDLLRYKAKLRMEEA